MPTIAANGTRLAYDEAGTGPAVVLIHAALADRRMWDHQFTALAGRHRVVRFDWRGQGGSGEAAGEFHRYRDVLGLMDALGIDQAALVGCSMGGSQALETALAAPDRVSALALICPGLGDFTWPAEVVERVRGRLGADRSAPALAAANVDELVVGDGRDRSVLPAETYALALAMCHDMFQRGAAAPAHRELFLDPPASTRLAEVAAPTLVIRGLADEPSLLALSARLAAEIPGARRLDLPDTAHVPPLERPAETSAAVAAFLDEVVGRPGRRAD